MFKKDQEIRKKYDVANEKKYIKKMSEVDAANREEFKRIFKDTGFIGLDSGEDLHEAAFHIVQHMPTSEVSFMKKYLRLMKKNINNTNPIYFALLTDRTRNWEEKPQLYGTQFVPVDGEINTYKMRPIYKPKEVDKRRVEIGLEPLKEYVDRISKERKVKLIY